MILNSSIKNKKIIKIKKKKKVKKKIKKNTKEIYKLNFRKNGLKKDDDSKGSLKLSKIDTKVLGENKDRINIFNININKYK